MNISELELDRIIERGLPNTDGSGNAELASYASGSQETLLITGTLVAGAVFTRDRDMTTRLFIAA